MTSKSVESEDPPPPMAHHTANEFLFASRTLRKMVLDSNFFPERAHKEDWFKPLDRCDSAGEEGAHGGGGDDSVGLEPELPPSQSGDAFPAEDGLNSFLPSLPPSVPARETEAGPAAEYSPVPSVHEKDIEYGPVLGKGGFCEVRLAVLKRDKGNKRHARLYAMKYLSPTKLGLKEDLALGPKASGQKPRNKQFERGIADLAIEARFLALLSHDNIIGLHYVSGGSLAEQFNCRGGDDFKHQFGLTMLIDPLFETLAKRIDDTYIPQVFQRREGGTRGSVAPQKWWKRVLSNKKSANLLPLMDSFKYQLAQRLESLKGIASALKYLHDDCRVIYRDCKPDNIGFYREGNLSSPSFADCVEIPKLFDFGLAKELKPKLLKAHPHHDRDHAIDTYKLTPRSGSRRYMAPEVAFSTPYSEKADVYSFGIVLYQVASLVTPFEGYTLYRHEKEVLCGGDRPNVRFSNNRRVLGKIRKGSDMSYDEWMEQNNPDKKEKYLEACTMCVWTQDLSRLVEECWHDDMRLRPSMKDVVQRLEGCIQELAPEGLRKSLMQETVSSGESGGPLVAP